MNSKVFLCGLAGLLVSMSSGCLIISTGGTTKKLPCETCPVEQVVECSLDNNSCCVKNSDGSSTLCEAAKSIEGSIEFQQGDEFYVVVPNGALTIQRWDKPCVAFSATVKAHGQTQACVQELLDQARIELTRKNCKVSISYSLPVLKDCKAGIKADMVVHMPQDAPTTTESTALDLRSCEQ